MMDHINSCYQAMQKDWTLVSGQREFNYQDVGAVREATTTMTRLFSDAVMILGIGITFFALPIVSSGVSVIGLAIGVSLFIIGHDLFTIAKNFENDTKVKNKEEIKQLLFTITNNMESETILKLLLTPTGKYWKPEIIMWFLGEMGISSEEKDKVRQAFRANYAQ